MNRTISVGKLVTVAAILFGCAAPAGAVVLTDDLVGAKFYDGGVATGSFSFDTATSTIVSWSISVSGGNTGTFPPIIYDTGNSTVSIGSADGFTAVFFVGPGDRDLRLSLENPLPMAGGITDPFHIWPDNQTGLGAGFECFDCAPFRVFSEGAIQTQVPEPASLALLGLGLAGLGFGRRRKSART